MNYDKLQDTDIKGDDEDGFWFGDPCYVVPDEMWVPFCDAWQAYDKRHQDDEDFSPHYVAETHDEETGVGFYSWSTAYGDGTYPLFVDGKQVARLGVDAGTLSAVPMKLIKHWQESGKIGDYNDLGHVVSSDHLRGSIGTDGGDFHWGDISLPTGDSIYEDEEECEEEGFFC